MLITSSGWFVMLNICAFCDAEINQLGSKYSYLYIWTDTTDMKDRENWRWNWSNKIILADKLVFFVYPSCTAPEIWCLAQISFSSNYNLLLTGASFSPGKGYKRKKEDWENNFRFENLVWKARLTLDLTYDDVYTFSFLNKMDLKSLPIFAVILFSTFPPAD